VIAWDVTANPEVAGPDDELVEAYDLEKFADAIARVCERGTPAKSPENFRFQTMIDEYYQELLQHSGLEKNPQQPKETTCLV